MPYSLQVRVARDHEEKVLFLLNKLQQKSAGDLGSGEINRIHEAEINQFSRLHDELRKMGEENERLKESQVGSMLGRQLVMFGMDLNKSWSMSN